MSQIAVLLGICLIVVSVFGAVDASAQRIEIGPWAFEQKIDGRIGNILSCQTNVPNGGDYNDGAMTQPILKARAKVGESGHPYSNCSAHVRAESELVVRQAPTLVRFECEARGLMMLEHESGEVAINATADIMDPSGIAHFTWTDCSPSNRTRIGTTEVIESHQREVCLQPGKYLMVGRLDVDAEIGLGAQFALADANMLDRIPSTGLHIYVEQLGGCPVLPTFGRIQDFDANSNSYLSDIEFFDAIDAWVNGQISNEVFFAAVDFWINITPLPIAASGVGAKPFQLEVSQSSGGLVFAAGPSVSQIDVVIYGLDGQEIFTSRSSGGTLRWGYQNMSGMRVANGIYLAQIRLVDGTGASFMQIEPIAVIN